MPRLAWDTSSLKASIALETGNGEVFSKNFDSEARISESLLHQIDLLLKTHSLSIDEIEEFIVGIGPGSFTGLRIGVTTARTLAFSLQKKLYGVPSLACGTFESAKKLLSQGEPETAKLAWIRNAFGGEIYCRYGTLREHLELKSTEVSISPDLWLQAEGNPSRDGFWLTGEDFALLPLVDSTHFKRLPLDPEISFAKTSLSQKKFLSGEDGDWRKVAPRYLRGSSAEEKRAKEQTLSGLGQSS